MLRAQSSPRNYINVNPQTVPSCRTQSKSFVLFFIFKFKASGLFFLLIIYFWLCWVFIAAHELSLVTDGRGNSLVAVLWLLITIAVEHRLEGIQVSIVVPSGL